MSCKKYYKNIINFDKTFKKIGILMFPSVDALTCIVSPRFVISRLGKRSCENRSLQNCFNVNIVSNLGIYKSTFDCECQP